MANGCWGQKGEFLIWALNEHPFPRQETKVAFHAHSGWYFSRDGSGQVTVTYPDGVVGFDKDTWASIVASVSFRGETAETFAEAQALHQGGAASAAMES